MLRAVFMRLNNYLYGENMIELINVTKTFRTEHDSVEAVSDVSLEIEKGDI